MSHTLSQKEITSISAGRIMNTFIAEYVFGEFPHRWSNSQQKDLPCHWFEDLPRACAEDDGGYCTADSVPNYSGDLTRAMEIAQAPIFQNFPLVTHTENAKTIFPVMENRFWATFSKIPFDQHSHYHNTWGSGDTLAMAICRAALMHPVCSF